MMVVKNLLTIALNLLLLLAIELPAGATFLKGYVSNGDEAGNKSQSESTGHSFPDTYEGAWSCQTEVVDSAVDAVKVGQQILSEIDFRRGANGSIVALWNQPGWLETQSVIVTAQANQAYADRTTCYYAGGINGAWSARCHDRFTQMGPDSIFSISYVDQYIDGQYLGRYQTKSVLCRIVDTDKVALK